MALGTKLSLGELGKSNFTRLKGKWEWVCPGLHLRRKWSLEVGCFSQGKGSFSLCVLGDMFGKHNHF